MELQHGRTRLVIDPANGSILRIEDTATGLVHFDATRGGRSDGRLFRLIVPTERWRARYADSQEQADVRSEARDGGVVLEYPDLKAADGDQTGVCVRVEILPSERPDEFLLTMHVENRGQGVVIDSTFPLLGGWHDQGGRERPGRPDRDRIVLGANSAIEPRFFPKPAGNNYVRNAQRGAWDYPVDLACPWVDVSGPEGGLSYTNYMLQGLNGKFWIENLAGYGDDFRLMMGWAHMIALRPGERWTSPPMGLAAHGGDWRATADRYGAWFDALHPPDYSRPLVRTRMGFQNVMFRGFDGTPIRPLEAIPRAAAAGRRCGIDMLCVWDTLTLGNYARYDPHDLTDYAPAERDLLLRGLKQAEAEGTRTCALTNFRHPNVGLHLSDPDLLDQVQRRYSGTFRTENWSANHTSGDLWTKHIGPESYVFSPFSEAHRERVLRLTAEYLDLGYSSMFYDQPFEKESDYGAMERGCAPQTTHHEALAMVARVRELLLARDPNAILIGEESDIHATSCIDQWMSWSIATPSPALLERLEMMRYAMPHTILSWVVDRELDRVAHAFALGMQLCLMIHGSEGTLDDAPELGEKIRALAALRRATAERTVMARFLGTKGLAIDGDDGFVAYAYDSPSGPAVIAAACGTGARGKVSVDRDAFSAPGGEAGGVVHAMDGATVAHSGDVCEFDLKANDVAVWTL